MMAPERLRQLLRDVQAGALTRTGYARFTLQWLGRGARRDQKLDVAALERLSLISWPSLMPGRSAELTTAGRSLLEALK